MNNFSKVLVIGSGAVVIGQSSEYDYSCVLACKALKEQGLKVVLLNPNPVTISTDNSVADTVYLEPINIDTVKKIIEKENIDAVLATVGGDAGFKIGLELTLNGYLEDKKIKLLGINTDIISKISNRKLFIEFLNEINEPDVSSKVVCSSNEAVEFASEIGYPVLVRPAYTLGNTGVITCNDEKELQEISKNQIALSKIGQIFVEKSISGWKEIEYEVVRDSAGNCISVCNMENMDCVGIHTGDSVVVIPAQTLTDKENLTLRTSALHIASELKIEGSCNVKFAIKSDGSEYAIIGVYPRVGRTSALVSKATGYKIVEVSVKIALGHKLFEIKNDITGCTTAGTEPAIDYCAIKMPTWSLNKMKAKHKKLGTSMQATGEALSIAPSFELALMKGIRSINENIETLSVSDFDGMSDDKLIEIIKSTNDQRMFAIYEAIKRDMSLKDINVITNIDFWFLSKLKGIANVENNLINIETEEDYLKAKKYGFTDNVIAKNCDISKFSDITATYKTVDTCAAEFDVNLPFFYSSWDEENESQIYINNETKDKKKVLLVGSGPSRTDQGIELDYALVNVAKHLKQNGYEIIVANNNPEAVSTSLEIADKLYLEPVTAEDVVNIAKNENVTFAVTQFCGFGASKITKELENVGVKILGSDSSLFDVLDSKSNFNALLDEFCIPHREYKYVYEFDKIVEECAKIGFPVSVKTSTFRFIAYNSKELVAQFEAVGKINERVLIEKYYIGIGININAVCDGENCFVPCISEHIERAGVNSGDSISVTPPVVISQKVRNELVNYTNRLSKALKIKGFANFEYVYFDNNIYLIDVTPTQTKTLSFTQKATGVDIMELATSCMLGEKLENISNIEIDKHVAVRVPVFSFNKMSDVDTQLNLEAKSTGEVIGIADNFEDALLKALCSSNFKINKKGGVLITVRDGDKQDCIAVADKFSQLGFTIYATAGTAKILNENFVATNFVRKIHEGSPNILDLLSSNKIDYVISTSTREKKSSNDDVLVRRRAVEREIPTLTSLDTASAIAKCLKKKRAIDEIELISK